tara:strand:+ start:950 stop:2320 length:1371 start_codon:yes stop_codon:yes gene_type:complete
VNKVLKLLLFFLLFNNCSFDNKTGIWSNYEEVKQEEIKLIKLTKKKNIIEEEFNPELQITLKEKTLSNQSWLFSDMNLSNLVTHMNFNGKVKKFSKFKFKRIIKRSIKEPDLIISNDFTIFYDNNGSILKFDKNSKLRWKVKIYNKKERNKIFNISLGATNDILFMADNLGKYYALDIDTGKIIWKKKINATFNSQLKVINNKILLIDNDNSLWCFSAKDGLKLWKFRTQANLIKPLKKLSLVVYKDSLIFSNSIGDVSKVDLETGSLIWQIPTQSTLVRKEIDFLKISDVVLYKNSIFLSNNNNNFYSLDASSGIINWVQNVNSFLRPIIIDELIFTISNKGYLVVIDTRTGEIIRITDLSISFKKKNKKKFSLVKTIFLGKQSSEVKKTDAIQGFVIASNKLYITTAKGKLMVYSILDGQIDQVLKVGSSKLSEPFISNNNLYIFRDNAVVVLN